MPTEFKGLRETEPPLRRSGPSPAGDKPADGLRAQPFTDDVFGEYHGRRKEAGTPFGLIAGLVIGVVAVAGIGWYMWTSGALTPAPAGGAPQLVKANPDPYKVKPDKPGGMQVENQDKLVYDRVAKGDAPSRVENLLPLPEEPKAPPRPAAPEAKPVAPPQEAAKAEAKPEVVTAAPPLSTEPAPAKPVEPPKPAESAKAPAPPQAEIPAAPAASANTAKPTPAKDPSAAAKPAPAKPEQDDLAAAVLAATGGREAATGPITAKPAAPPAAKVPPAETAVAAAPAVTPPSAPAPSAPAPTPAAVAAGFQIQLAAARSEAGAMGEWNRIVGKNKDALAGLTPSVLKVDLGEKGVFFRLRAGPLADKAAADAVCATLGAQNVGCLVIPP